MLVNIMLLLHVALAADPPASLGEGAGVLQVAGGPAAGGLVLEVAPTVLQTRQSIFIPTHCSVQCSGYLAPLTW